MQKLKTMVWAILVSLIHICFIQIGSFEFFGIPVWTLFSFISSAIAACWMFDIIESREK